MLDLEVCRGGSKEGEIDGKWGRERIKWKSQAQAGKYDDTLEPMSFLVVSDLDGLGHQKPGSFVMELSLDTWLKNQRS